MGRRDRSKLRIPKDSPILSAKLLTVQVMAFAGVEVRFGHDFKLTSDPCPENCVSLGDGKWALALSHRAEDCRFCTGVRK